jgi:hypothetical protein
MKKKTISLARLFDIDEDELPYNEFEGTPFLSMEMARMTYRMEQNNVPRSLKQLIGDHVPECPILYYQDDVRRNKQDIKVIAIRFGHTRSGIKNLHDALSIWLGFVRDANMVAHSDPNMQFRVLCVETEGRYMYYMKFDRPRTKIQSQIDQYFLDKFIQVAEIVTDSEFSIKANGKTAFNEQLGVLEKSLITPVAFSLAIHEKELNELNKKIYTVKKSKK